jgi:hypothetical protein
MNVPLTSRAWKCQGENAWAAQRHSLDGQQFGPRQEDEERRLASQDTTSRRREDSHLRATQLSTQVLVGRRHLVRERVAIVAKYRIVEDAFLRITHLAKQAFFRNVSIGVFQQNARQ